jgi:hypothetical protein
MQAAGLAQLLIADEIALKRAAPSASAAPAIEEATNAAYENIAATHGSPPPFAAPASAAAALPGSSHEALISPVPHAASSFQTQFPGPIARSFSQPVTSEPNRVVDALVPMGRSVSLPHPVPTSSWMSIGSKGIGVFDPLFDWGDLGLTAPEDSSGDNPLNLDHNAPFLDLDGAAPIFDANFSSIELGAGIMGAVEASLSATAIDRPAFALATHCPLAPALDAPPTNAPPFQPLFDPPAPPGEEAPAQPICLDLGPAPARHLQHFGPPPQLLEDDPRWMDWYRAYRREYYPWLVTQRVHYPAIWWHLLDAALEAQLEPEDWVRTFL